MVKDLPNVKLQVENEESSWFCFGIILKKEKNIKIFN